MLELVDIRKDYEVGNSVYPALKGISLSFRNSEFVSILGPSGSGKTTLLNIIGGLDHYTSGDLRIDGISTKEFTSRDWDTYRNHKVGFIFQSYNLIPQETLLENVELALTISGISKEERKKRSQEALDQVGLGEMAHKHPNQLSGGQCQRVAIARALVNNPSILLADEPTGALDSVTSVQVMDLIQKISQDRLVIMVTHNPELAKRYSTRIINLKDGQVTEDSRPVLPEEKKETKEVPSSQLGRKSRMSFWTAFKLSAKNLWYKKSRTIMTVLAASIGIIGVSSVLAVRSGVMNYLAKTQDELLSGNPIEVSTNSFDLATIVSKMTTVQQGEVVKEGTQEGRIDVDFMTKTLINSAKQMGVSMVSNDINQDYLDFVSEMPSSYYQEIQYHYGTNPTYNLYTTDDIDGYEPNTAEEPEKSLFSVAGIRQIATSVLEYKLAQTGYSSYASLITSYSNVLSESLSNESYLLSQYDVVKGKVATGEDEIMLVLSSDEKVTDLTLTLLGYFSQDAFLNVVYKYNTDANGNPEEGYDESLYERTKSFAEEDILNKPFYYYGNNTVFTKNSGLSASVHPFGYSYQKQEGWAGTKLKVVGILKPKEGRSYNSLSSGFYYTPAFTRKYIQDNENSQLGTFLTDYVESQEKAGKSATGYTSSVATVNGVTNVSGITYDYRYQVDGKSFTGTGLVGSTSSGLASLFRGMNTSIQAATLTPRAAGAVPKGKGGSYLPTRISFYPNSFATKNLVTDYLSLYNEEKDLTLKSGKVIPYETIAEDGTKKTRAEVRYTDNLSVVMSMVDNIINAVTIALVVLTALSLVVSTAMIGIITYVSVIERIKEIGVIRALGGRKLDVANLFNAETLIVGFSSGLFGILITYVLQAVVNAIVRSHFAAIGSIVALPPLSALLIILVSVLLTTLAGLLPALSASRKDPVVALRTE